MSKIERVLLGTEPTVGISAPLENSAEKNTPLLRRKKQCHQSAEKGNSRVKSTHTCPKCNSTDIIRIEGYVGAYGSGNNIPSGLFSSVKVNRYLCCSCGYSEKWIDREDIPDLKKKYKKRETKRETNKSDPTGIVF